MGRFNCVNVLVFSDLQADEGSLRLRSQPDIPLQRWRTERFYALAAELVESEGCQAVWDLGDTTDNRTSLAIRTINVVTGGCAKLTRGLVKPYCLKLIGNHEQTAKTQDNSCASLFSPYFSVVEDRLVVVAGKTSVVCLSFPYDNAAAAAWLAETVAREKQRGQTVIVIGHAKIAGAKLNSGTATDGIPTEAFASADLALFGHVHKRQAIGKNGYYVGSPFQQDFGEAADPEKATAILDTETLALRWVALPGFPRYKTICVDELERAAKSDDVLNVVIRTPAEAERFYAHPASQGVEPVYALDEVAATDEPKDVELGRTFEDTAEDYVKAVPSPDADRDELLAAARALQ